MVTTNEKAINTVYNVAYGDRNTLNDLMGYLKEYLSEFDSKISNVRLFTDQIEQVIFHIHMQVLIKQKKI